MSNPEHKSWRELLLMSCLLPFYGLAAFLLTVYMMLHDWWRHGSDGVECVIYLLCVAVIMGVFIIASGAI